MKNNTNEELIEIWDWQTETPTGQPALRRECHKKGIPHEGVHLWIISEISGEHYILFQLRAPHKEMYPNVLDITVGGHVPFGLNEKKIDKEAFEEIGIVLKKKSLIDLGYYRYEEKEENYFHREFQHIYLLKDNRPLQSYQFNDKEVSALYAVPYSYVKEIMITNKSIKAKFYNGETITTQILTKNDFHPLLFAQSMEKYMSLLFNAIDRLL